MQYAQNWEKTKTRFQAFWEGEIVDRCCIAIFAPKKDCNYSNEEVPARREEKIRYWTDGEYVLKRMLNYFENTYFGGDAFPQIFINLGAAGHAGFFKNIKFEFEDTVWFMPYIEDVEKDEIQFDPEAVLYKKTIELAKYFTDESRKRYFVSMPDHAGNADALAHMRGTQNLLIDMLSNKEWVNNALNIIQGVWENVQEQIFQIVSKNNDGGSSIGWLNTWAPCKHTQMQCDMSVMISPQMYNEFIKPEIEAQTKWMGRSLYHFDGVEQIKHLDMLLSIESLDAIQWQCVVGQQSPSHYIDILKRIQNAGKKLVIWNDEPNEIEFLLEHLSSRGLLLAMHLPSEDDAKRMIKTAERLTHE